LLVRRRRFKYISAILVSFWNGSPWNQIPLDTSHLRVRNFLRDAPPKTGRSLMSKKASPVGEGGVVHAQAGHTESSFCADVKQDGESEDHPGESQYCCDRFHRDRPIISLPVGFEHRSGRCVSLAWGILGFRVRNPGRLMTAPDGSNSRGPFLFRQSRVASVEPEKTTKRRNCRR
jgi:hypothetical protein